MIEFTSQRIRQKFVFVFEKTQKDTPEVGSTSSSVSCTEELCDFPLSYTTQKVGSSTIRLDLEMLSIHSDLGKKTKNKPSGKAPRMKLNQLQFLVRNAISKNLIDLNDTTNETDIYTYCVKAFPQYLFLDLGRLSDGLATIEKSDFLTTTLALPQLLEITRWLKNFQDAVLYSCRCVLTRDADGNDKSLCLIGPILDQYTWYLFDGEFWTHLEKNPLAAKSHNVSERGYYAIYQKVATKTEIKNSSKVALAKNLKIEKITNNMNKFSSRMSKDHRFLFQSLSVVSFTDLKIFFKGDTNDWLNQGTTVSPGK